MFKVNFEKAYDSISWEFLLYMLKGLGFRSKWIHWINGCLESSWASVSVNGSPIHEFKCFKGLRQGDLLALCLFLIVVEGLSGLMRKARGENLFGGYVVGDNGCKISMLQYVDDTNL